MRKNKRGRERRKGNKMRKEERTGKAGVEERGRDRRRGDEN